MLSTAVAILAVIALVLPGFVVADLSQRKRADRKFGTDWELVLRALFYAVCLHVAFAPWTAHLVPKLEGQAWQDHVGAIMVYALVVLVIVPVAVGLALGAVLERAEANRGLTWFHGALGARDDRQVWDWLFQRLDRHGAWLRLVLKNADGSNMPVLAKYGAESAHSIGLDREEAYFEEVWTVDPKSGLAAQALEPRTGLWIHADQIDRLEVLDPAWYRRPGDSAHRRKQTGGSNGNRQAAGLAEGDISTTVEGQSRK